MSHNPKDNVEASSADQGARSKGYRDAQHQREVQDALNGQASDNADALRTADDFMKAPKR